LLQAEMPNKQNKEKQRIRSKGFSSINEMLQTRATFGLDKLPRIIKRAVDAPINMGYSET